jgi:serine/threonine-protein kinase
MSINADLAKWGEPPASTAEETLADRLQEALDTLRRGKLDPMTAVACASAPSLLVGEARAGGSVNELALVETATWVEDLAASIRDNSAVPAAADDLPDPFPGEFQLRELLAEGTFGKVWLADDLNIGRQVALKMLKLPRQTGQEVIAVVRNEAQLLDSVCHPNIVKIFAVRQSGEDYYLVLQYVAGGSLAARLLQQGRLPWQRACRYTADVGEALLQVHARGIVHRDIKPANILWNSHSDEAVLTDFGISCRLIDPRSAAGTLPYLGPEAFDGRVTPALDVFALAATLFQLITGEVPFPAGDELEHIDRVLTGLPQPDPRCETIPPAIEQLIRDGLSAEADQRPGLEQFVNRLRGTLNRLLADNICVPVALASGPAPVDLRIVVSQDTGPNNFVPTAVVGPGQHKQWQDTTQVPPGPEQVRLRTGDRIRVRVSANRAGFLTAFNVGPTGNLHMLWPEDPTPRWQEADQPIDVLDVAVTPPPGRERLVAAWSRLPLPVSELLRLTGDQGEGVSRPYLATRDLERVDKSMRQLLREDWHAVVLELDHQE